jgi:hypothetical protein
MCWFRHRKKRRGRLLCWFHLVPKEAMMTGEVVCPYNEKAVGTVVGQDSDKQPLPLDPGTLAVVVQSGDGAGVVTSDTTLELIPAAGAVADTAYKITATSGGAALEGDIILHAVLPQAVDMAVTFVITPK